ncbi:DUF2855 family protein [Variovorax sp. E3]|uniref:DUF2855 family protein n=1 Tax=Variovorax sp. E3 TaxID=1914993 RepID=UPI0027DD0993|nr:DUF2855 family protein [Variovorax sp. E3]
MAQCGNDPSYAPETEDAQAVLRPLVITFRLLSDLVEECQWDDACQVLISSAWSETTYGTALPLRVACDWEVVVVTSRGNVALCENLGCYDRVVAYDDVGELDHGTSRRLRDYSGNCELRMALHSHLRAMRHSLAIGYTHVRQLRPAGHIPEPPVQYSLRTIASGSARPNGCAEVFMPFGRSLRRARGFLRPSGGGEPLLAIERHKGLAGVKDAYLHVLRGGGDPRVGRLESLGTA